MRKAITIIKDEHRAFAAVLRGLEYLIGQIRDGKQKPDFALFKSMLTYVKDFPDKLHHPKEDEYVYHALRQRDPSATPMLDELEDEHRCGPEFIQRVAAALQEYENDPSRFEVFAKAMAEYTQFQWEHMRKEEDVILPLAEKSLLPDDWTEIDSAFSSNADPLVGVGTQREFRDLFRKVVNLMPAPMGLGPEAK